MISKASSVGRLGNSAPSSQSPASLGRNRWVALGSASVPLLNWIPSKNIAIHPKPTKIPVKEYNHRGDGKWDCRLSWRAEGPESQKIPARPGNIVTAIAEVILATNQRPYAFGNDLGCHRNSQAHMAAEIAEQVLVF